MSDGAREHLVRLKEISDQYSNELKGLSLADYLDQWVLHLPWPAWAKTPDGKMIFVNPSYSRRYGKMPEKYMGHTDHENWANGEGMIFNDGDREVAETGKASLYIEPVYNEIIKANEKLVCLKFPIYEGFDLVAIGGIAPYLPMVEYDE